MGSHGCWRAGGEAAGAAGNGERVGWGGGVGGGGGWDGVGGARGRAGGAEVGEGEEGGKQSGGRPARAEAGSARHPGGVRRMDTAEGAVLAYENAPIL